MDENSKRTKVMNRMLEEIKEILYAEDRANRKNKTDKLLEILREEYDF